MRIAAPLPNKRQASRASASRLRLDPLEPRHLLSAVAPGLPELALDGGPALEAAEAKAAASAPVVTIVATDATAGEAAGQTGLFTVTRSVVTDAPLIVRFGFRGTAENGDDFVHLRHVVIIPANEAAATITLTPRDDRGYEGDETAILRLRHREAYGLDPAQRSGTVTIGDNEPVLSIEATDSAAGEQGADPGVFTIRRSVVTDAPLVVHYLLMGTAEEGDDFRHLVKTVIIPANEATATITVTPKDDKARDPGETVVPVLLARHIYGVDPAHGSATLTITDNEQTVSIRATDATAAEAGLDPAVFTVERTIVTAEPLVVHYSWLGTAENGHDYTRLPGQVTIPANTATATITVTPIDDTLRDPGETAIPTLEPRHAYGVDPTKASATATITDNEQTVSIQATDPLAAEQGRATGVFTVTRSIITDTPLIVHYDLTGTARNGKDYDALGPTVTIPPNANTATITVTPVDDTVRDPDESAIAVLRRDDAFGIDPTRASATILITDNEPAL